MPQKKRPPSPEEIRRDHLEASNGLLLYDRVKELVTTSVARPVGPVITPKVLLDFHAIATGNLEATAGQFRAGRVYITNNEHRPPPAEDVERLTTDCVEYVQNNWDATDAIHLAAYVLWRVNWIHPFEDGNGRVARAASYLVLSRKLGYVLRGTKTIPSMIVSNRKRFYEALIDADVAWRGEHIRLEALERLLSDYLARQIDSSIPDGPVE